MAARPAACEDDRSNPTSGLLLTATCDHLPIILAVCLDLNFLAMYPLPFPPSVEHDERHAIDLVASLKSSQRPAGAGDVQTGDVIQTLK